jgi:carboxyl-terminal processing protease
MDVTVVIRSGGKWLIAAMLPLQLEAARSAPVAGPDLDPAAIQERISGIKVGIGVQLQATETGAKIERVLPGNPADRAGIKAGEVITAVDGQPVAGLPMATIVGRIAGEEGTQVSLTVCAADGTSREVRITRMPFKTSPATARLLPANLGLITVPEFNKTTTEDVQNHLKSLQAGGARAVVLDLRHCAGATLDPARELAESFLPKGTAIWTQHPVKGRPVTVRARRSGNAEVPVAVFIGAGTAGPSELLASALGENGRAILIGSKTSGHVRLRNLVTNPSGRSELVDICSFATGRGRPITDHGVEPEVPVAAGTPDEEWFKLAAQRLMAPQTGNARETSR